MKLSEIAFFPAEKSEQTKGNWSPVCSHYQGLQRPFLITLENLGMEDIFLPFISWDCHSLKQMPYDPMTFFFSEAGVEKLNLRLHHSALLLRAQSILYSRLENKSVVIFLLSWDL